MHVCKFVGNKAKGRISKPVFQENKARQIFRKTNIFYPLIRPRTCPYQGVKNVRFSENLACFLFLKHRFWDSLFCLITEELWNVGKWDKEFVELVEDSLQKFLLGPFLNTLSQMKHMLRTVLTHFRTLLR